VEKLLASSRNLPGKSIEKHENFSQVSSTRPRFEMSISKIQVQKYKMQYNTRIQNSIQ
jgi:hypothetical protein